MRLIYTLTAAIVLCSCKNKTTTSTLDLSPVTEQVVESKIIKTPFTEGIEQAHQMDAFMSHKAVQYTIQLIFGGSPRMNGTITQMTNGTKIRIDLNDGSSMLFDGENVYSFPKEAEIAGVRFTIFTWPYFFSMPYKLNDYGTSWSNDQQNNWGGQSYDTSKLTFSDGVGDSPKDWYEVYKNSKTNVMEGAAYIVTFGKDLAKAESNPHAIKFSDFTNIEGVPFASSWSFHNWNIEEGYTDTIGTGKITDIKFVDPTEEFFNIPESSILVPML